MGLISEVIMCDDDKGCDDVLIHIFVKNTLAQGDHQNYVSIELKVSQSDLL